MNKKAEVLDMNITGLPQQISVDEIKRTVGAKHIVSATLEVDSIRGVCTGKGRMSVRLQEGESADQLKMNLVKKGYNISDAKLKANKNTGFSAGQSL